MLTQMERRLQKLKKMLNLSSILNGTDYIIKFLRKKLVFLLKQFVSNYEFIKIDTIECLKNQEDEIIEMYRGLM